MGLVQLIIEGNFIRLKWVNKSSSGCIASKANIVLV